MQKKNLVWYPAILTSCLANNPYLSAAASNETGKLNIPDLNQFFQNQLQE